MKLLRPALAAVLLLGLAACSRVTADNYDRLQTGMTRVRLTRSPAAASAA
jgi:hypothetical protein